MKLNGFNRIAFIYDILAKFVFGRSIYDSQKFFLNRISDNSKVLILGGGSGWILAELLNQKPNCEIWYIDASQKMITLSKNKIHPTPLVHFIHGTEQNIPPSVKYNLLITNFYLDLFTDDQLMNIIAKLQSSMKSDALWIVTDFVNNKKWWQAMMLKTMYWFFRVTCNIESRKLPEWNRLVDETDVKEVDSKTFYGGFIKTALYQF